jgi:uncharacterized metal-binding protein
LRHAERDEYGNRETVMAEAVFKIGIISCSGEEIPEGTVSRLAARRVLEALRPRQTVTLCLPLFLAGEAGERRFAREHPTITVDGCPKLCAKRGTEQYSGLVSASLVVSDILGDRATACRRSARDAGTADQEAVWIVAERIAAEVDSLLASGAASEPGGVPAAGACCACGGPPPEGNLEIDGKPVAVNGLPLIFQQLRKNGLQADGACAEAVLEAVRIYHYVEPGLEDAYRGALVSAYRAYCRKGKDRKP